MKYLSILFFLLVSSLCYPEDLEYTVCQVGVEAEDDVYLLPCETHEGQQGCPAGGRWLHWKLGENPAANGKLAIAISAMNSGKKVIVRTEGCSNRFDHVFMLRLSR